MSSFKLLVKKFRNKAHIFSTILIVTLIFSSFNFWNFVFATNITGIISTDTTWNEADSPYVLTGNVLVEENVTLTIDPGTTVNLGSYYMQIDGTLVAQGHPSNLINLTSGEIRFTALCQNWNESSNSGCIIENALLNSSSIDMVTSTIKINNCSILNTAVGVGGGSSIVSNNTLIESSISSGILVTFGLNMSPKIVNNFISEGGIHLEYSFGSGTPLIENNLIANNVAGIGIQIIHSSLTPIIRNNTITNNSIGVSINWANQNQTILYNNIYQNLDYNLRLYNTYDDINATYNYWGTTNTTLINQTIVDYYDDFPLGVVDFVPLLENLNPNAPTISGDEIKYVQNLDTGLDYSSIQDAINAPATLGGHTLFVDSGTHFENVAVNKSLSIIGENPSNTIIDGGGTGDVLLITADNVQITNFTIQNSGESSSGLAVTACNNTIITNNNITQNFRGLYVFSSAFGNFRNNTLVENSQNLGVVGLDMDYFLQDMDTSNLVNGKPVYYWINKKNDQVPLDAGFVALVNCTNVSVKNIDLSNNINGLTIAFSNSSIIENNNATNNHMGIALFSGSFFNQIIGNNIQNNSQCGIVGFGSVYRIPNNTITQNQISGNANGILLTASSNTTISNNNITTNSMGIFFSGTNNSTVSQNIIQDNDLGIELDFDVETNRFYHNSIINNTVTASSLTNYWDNGYPSGGNYWSGYSDVDIFSGPNQDIPDSDGVWDNPYFIDAENQDNYPLVDRYDPLVPVENIFAGGSYNDGVFDNSQVIVWDSETLGYEGSANWQWTNNTVVNSVALGDVDDDGVIEIVSGGSYNDGTFDNAQLIVWNSETLAYEASVNWQWIDNTCVNSVALADIDDDGVVEIVSGGYYNDGTFDNAQIIVWNGETLSYEGSANWQWTADTVVNSVSLADVDDDGVMEIVSGGRYNDSTFDNAQLIVWSGKTLGYEGSANWQWVADTSVNSVVLADVDDDDGVEIVSGGYYNDGTYDNAQIIIWNGETLAYEKSANWQWINNTCVKSIG